MNIGEPKKIHHGVPEPIRIPQVTRPIRVPEKVPVRVIPQREPAKVGASLKALGFQVTEIPYSCPKCGKEMEMQDGLVFCPEHGVVYSG